MFMSAIWSTFYVLQYSFFLLSYEVWLILPKIMMSKKKLLHCRLLFFLFCFKSCYVVHKIMTLFLFITESQYRFINHNGLWNKLIISLFFNRGIMTSMSFSEILTHWVVITNFAREFCRVKLLEVVGMLLFFSICVKRIQKSWCEMNSWQ